MIIRYRTTKAPKGQQTAGRGAAPAPLPVVLSALRALVVSLRINMKYDYLCIVKRGRARHGPKDILQLFMK